MVRLSSILHNIFQENLKKIHFKYFNLYRPQFTILISVLLMLQIKSEKIWQLLPI